MPILPLTSLPCLPLWSSPSSWPVLLPWQRPFSLLSWLLSAGECALFSLTCRETLILICLPSVLSFHHQKSCGGSHWLQCCHPCFLCASQGAQARPSTHLLCARSSGSCPSHVHLPNVRGPCGCLHRWLQGPLFLPFPNPSFKNKTLCVPFDEASAGFFPPGTPNKSSPKEQPGIPWFGHLSPLPECEP